MSSMISSNSPQRADLLVSKPSTRRPLEGGDKKAVSSVGATLPPEASDSVSKEEVLDTKTTQDMADRADTLVKDVERAVERVRDAIKLRQSSIEFQVQEPHKDVIVTVRDKETQEVVRQIPSEEMLRIAKAIDENFEGGADGLFLSDRA